MDEVPKEYGTESMWERCLQIFGIRILRWTCCLRVWIYRFQDADFYDLLYGEEYNSWLFHIYLVMNVKAYEGKYLGYVLKKSKDLDSFKKGILCDIIGVSHTSAEYQEFYKERKRLLSHYPEAEIAPFVNENRVNVSESVYKLTDNTMVEKQEIIIWVANNGIPENLGNLYPDLAAYINRYPFNGNGLNDAFAARITTYFEKYKELKLRNRLNDDFSKEVDKLALERYIIAFQREMSLLKKRMTDSHNSFGLTRLEWNI